ncbi:P-loop containing nucleoside triphosphate hydrolase protein [Truncatella angustata]|uniref:P-loop containing nucleoside triphosphate hydrolase protein n=1 Tax=Truncatella angustata TaxID=152316 RepID=A0A9P8RPN1_9PEZI|nr:P-loop containing nucleoside triphosphate hydrolase protein [Truncatella angustata]KAH6647898.1 P-loop containing nucleoside triphosphate hydrolase protein [Truncatella angustata]
MDQFYLKNAAKYQDLVNALKPAPKSSKAKMTTETSSPDIIVSTRIRPLSDEDEGFPRAVFPQSSQHGVLDIHDLYNHPKGRPLLKSFKYQVDRVFDEDASTEKLYWDVVVDLIPLAQDGGIGTLFAYGQTGSGKTYTVSRLEQLVVESLLDSGDELGRQVYISVIELAGNSAYDLLSSRKPIQLLEDSFGVTQMAGADEQLVQSRDQAMELIERAASFRQSASTFKNDASSRSHGICRIRIKNSSTGSEGFLYLIDLAGSEMARDIAKHGADRMRETRQINISLSVLKDCIRGKAESDAMAALGGSKSKQKRPHVPFRQSALTKVLKHMFDSGGSRRCKTVIIACVNPSLADVVASKSTIRYAETLRVLVPATAQTASDPLSPKTWTNTELRDWIMKNSGISPSSSTALAPTESGAQFLRLAAEDFVARHSETPDVNAEEVRAVYSKLWQMHVDSQKVDGSSSKLLTGITSSRNPDRSTTALPFKDRIRAGMVVRWRQAYAQGFEPKESLGVHKDSLAVVLCPAATPKSTTTENNSIARYSCAVVTPGAMTGSYEVNLWRQVVVDVEMMDKEVIMEYDPATRYYYVSV